MTAKKDLQALKAAQKGKRRTARALSRLQAAQTAVKLSHYYEDARQLSKLLTEWSISLGPGMF